MTNIKSDINVGDYFLTRRPKLIIFQVYEIVDEYFRIRCIKSKHEGIQTGLCLNYPLSEYKSLEHLLDRWVHYEYVPEGKAAEVLFFD